MSRKVFTLVFVVTLLVIGGWYLAEAQSKSTRLFTGSIDVRIINLEAVVTDRDGQRVTGLTADDLVLYVDGKAVELTHFTEVRDGAYVQDVERYPGVRTGEPSPTSFLVFIDEFFAMPNDKKTVLRELKERVPNMQPGDQLAVTAWDGKELVVIADWTSSVDEAVAAMETAVQRRSYGLNRQQERQQFDVGMRPQDLAMMERQVSYHDRFSLDTQERLYADMLVFQLNGVAGAATAAMRTLDTPPGRKVMLLASGGWPMDIDNYIARSSYRAIYDSRIPSGAQIYGSITETANLLGYTVYPVDMPGMQSTGGGSAELGEALNPMVYSTQFYLEGNIHNALYFIAGETGGTAFINGQRVTALDEASKDLDSFYWLGFSPEWQGDDERHEFEIKAKDPELQVRARTGFTDFSMPSQVKMAIESALLYAPATSDPNLLVNVTNTEKLKKKRVEATIEIVAPADLFATTRNEDGYLVQLLIFVAALDENGGRSDVQPIQVAFASPGPPEPGQKIRYEAKLTLSRNTSRVSVAVHDPIGGATLVRTVTSDEARAQLEASE